MNDRDPNDDRERAVEGGPPQMSPEEARRRRGRNIAIGVVLGLLAVLFYAMTIARLGENVLNRPL
ncbi:hypothetical protein [Chelatococcus composti]|jgi:hypothetical protein|uniref:CoxF protein n=1 Tax=Chelatococcus composti TaxID=1743235 RepID=A0A841K894_9HYPH|nr:hypothetical protein [Chelatococcus composti]MBB6168525.1 hypothetical protein [Chelatococcus composti]MBS7736396.1 hypothetical protein [Chelatococcus composti]PZN41968.1 MAG: hypothetical protein DIU59_08505 [Pseudomonadota bacterium]GGG40721.1 hypothetical protein GCM10008026_22110 [Chelatococcus composti]